MNVIKIALMAIVIFIGCHTVSAQTPAPKDPTKNDPLESVIKLDTKLVVLDAQVLKKQTGLAVTDLKREDFSLFEDGVKQEITNFSQDRLPLSIVLLFEIDNNVISIIDQLRRGPIQSLRRLLPDDEIALMAFGSSTKLVQGFTTNKQLVIDKLDNLQPFAAEVRSTQPFIKKAIYEAGIQLRKARNPVNRRVVILITNNLSKEPLLKLGVLQSKEETLDMLAQTGAIVSAIVSATLTTKLKAELREKTLDQLVISKLFSKSNVNIYANETGGEVQAADSSEAETVFNGIVEHLRTRYIFGYSSSNPEKADHFRKIELKVNAEIIAREGELIIKARRGYNPLNYYVSRERPGSSTLAEDVAPPFEIVNLMPQFWRFWEQARSLGNTEKKLLFRKTFLDQYPKLFNSGTLNLTAKDAALNGEANFEKELDRQLDQYFARLPLHIEKLRRLSDNLERDLPRYQQIFLTKFPDLQWHGKIYLMPTIGIYQASNPSTETGEVLIFGLDTFAMTHSGEVKFTPFFYRELFKLYHRQFQPQTSPKTDKQALYQYFWDEGLAIYIDKLLNPTASDEEHLLAELPLDQVAASLPQIAHSMREKLDEPLSKDHLELFFKYDSSGIDRRVPGGYYLAYLVADSLATGYQLNDLVKLQGEDLKRAIDYALRKYEHQ